MVQQRLSTDESTHGRTIAPIARALQVTRILRNTPATTALVPALFSRKDSLRHGERPFHPLGVFLDLPAVVARSPGSNTTSI